MTRKTTLALAAAAVLAAAASAGLFGRDKVLSLWTDKPLAVDANDTDWKDSSAFESEGLSVQAMNDGESLWLMVTAHTRDARDLLVGETKQDVALWFLTPDGKARTWGARLPFSHRESLATALRDPAGIDPQPELVTWQGAAVSSAAWPADLADRLSSTGRRPVWELKVPLSRLSPTPERAVALDLAVSAPAAAFARKRRTDEEPEARGRRRDRPAPAPEDGPTAMTLTMSVRLAAAPGTR